MLRTLTALVFASILAAGPARAQFFPFGQPQYPQRYLSAIGDKDLVEHRGG